MPFKLLAFALGRQLPGWQALRRGQEASCERSVGHTQHVFVHVGTDTSGTGSEFSKILPRFAFCFAFWHVRRKPGAGSAAGQRGRQGGRGAEQPQWPGRDMGLSPAVSFRGILLTWLQNVGRRAPRFCIWVKYGGDDAILAPNKYALSETGQFCFICGTSKGQHLA